MSHRSRDAIIADVAENRAGGQQPSQCNRSAIEWTRYISSMLARVLKSSRTSTSLVRASPGCALRVQETVFKLFYSAQTPQAPDSKQESSSETTTDPFLAHLQQKTEKELFEILRKQQQQPSTQDDDEEMSVGRNYLRPSLPA